MRTTINVREDVLRRAKKVALERGSTFNEVVDRALAEYLARQEQLVRIVSVKLPRSKQKGGVQPGVNLDDTAALLDLLERDS